MAKDRVGVVVAGGGVAALETALALQALAGDRVEVQLLGPEPHFWYRPLSVLEPFDDGRVRPLEVAALARACGATFDLGTLALVEPDRRCIRTVAGAEYAYDALVVACGARAHTAVAGAFTFRGPGDSEALSLLLRELTAATPARLVFAVPAGAAWPLPLYELALLTATHLAGQDVEIAFATPEDEPLGILGPEASAAAGRLLEERGIELHTGSAPVGFHDGTLALSTGRTILADRVVSLPRLVGPDIPGLPKDSDGFVPTDAHGRVEGVDDVYAAGDATTFPVKQGGLAALQADAVAEAIAAAVGANVDPQPFQPILRGLLVTGGAPLFVRRGLDDAAAEATVSTEALWWPPGKIVGHYLAPFLAEHADDVLSPPDVGTLAVAVALPAHAGADA
jgi:sulfide:quinone oxidoreductase